MAIYKNNKKVIGVRIGSRPVASIARGQYFVYEENVEPDVPDVPTYEPFKGIAFEWDTTKASEIVFRLGGVDYTATTSPYSATYEELGFDVNSINEWYDQIFLIPNQPITKINQIYFPDHLSTIQNVVMGTNWGGETLLPDLEEVTIDGWNIGTSFWGSYNIFTNVDVKRYNFTNCSVDEAVWPSLNSTINWYADVDKIVVNLKGSDERFVKTIAEDKLRNYGGDASKIEFINYNPAWATCEPYETESEHTWNIVTNIPFSVAYDDYPQPSKVVENWNIFKGDEFCNNISADDAIEYYHFNVVFSSTGSNLTGEKRTVTGSVYINETQYVGDYTFVQRAEGEDLNIDWKQLTMDTAKDIPMVAFRVDPSIQSPEGGYFFACFSPEPNFEGEDYDIMHYSICTNQNQYFNNRTAASLDECISDSEDPTKKIVTFDTTVYWKGGEQYAPVDAIEYATEI